MVSELVLTFILSISNNSFVNSNYRDCIDGFNVVSCETDNLYVLENGNYLSILQPLNNSQENDYHNDRSSTIGYASISSKFIKVNGNGYFDNYSYVRVGEDALLDLNGNSSVYKSAFKIGLSSFPSYYQIFNAGIVFYKQNGTLNSINCYQISNNDYDNLTGTYSYTSNYIGSSSTSFLSNAFHIDLTEEVIDALSNSEDYISILLEASENNKIANLYSTTCNDHFPVIYVEYASTLYGNAPDFASLQNLTAANCLGFVQKLNQIIDIDGQLSATLGNTTIDENVMQSTVCNLIKNVFGPSYFRLIDSYNSPIYQNERRIAFRVKLLEAINCLYGGDYHFACQCDDGSWACKFGTGQFGNYPNDCAPEIYTAMWYNWQNMSQILYFAYSFN